jgi:hypothetical protein
MGSCSFATRAGRGTNQIQWPYEGIWYCRQETGPPVRTPSSRLDTASSQVCNTGRVEFRGTGEPENLRVDAAWFVTGPPRRPSLRGDLPEELAGPAGRLWHPSDVSDGSGYLVSQMDEAKRVYSDLAYAREAEPKRVYCAFVDLLGISARASDFDRLRATMLDAFEWLFTPPHIYGAMTRGMRLSVSKERETKVMLLSDAVVIVCQELDVLIDSVSLGIGGCLRRGILTRGCISEGLHLQVSVAGNQLVMGDALARAYAGESRLAIYPRVVLEPGLSEKVSKRGLVRYLFQDEDSLWCVNPTALWEDEDWEGRQALEHLARQLEEQAGNEHILQKLAWLTDFLNATLFPNFDIYYDRRPSSFREALSAQLETWNGRDISPVPLPIWKLDTPQERRFLLLPQVNWTLEGSSWKHLKSGVRWEAPPEMASRSYSANLRHMRRVDWPV